MGDCFHSKVHIILVHPAIFSMICAIILCYPIPPTAHVSHLSNVNEITKSFVAHCLHRSFVAVVHPHPHPSLKRQIDAIVCPCNVITSGILERQKPSLFFHFGKTYPRAIVVFLDIPFDSRFSNLLTISILIIHL